MTNWKSASKNYNIQDIIFLLQSTFYSYSRLKVLQVNCNFQVSLAKLTRRLIERRKVNSGIPPRRTPFSITRNAIGRWALAA